jgi:hypothetical protein
VQYWIYSLIIDFLVSFNNYLFFSNDFYFPEQRSLYNIKDTFRQQVISKE